MTRDEQTEHGRSERTRTTRFFEAMQLTRPIVDDMRQKIECVLRKEHAAEESLKAAALASYEKASGVLTEVGLEIRHRALEYTVMDVPGRTATLRIDVEFALAAPLDDPDAPLSGRAARTSAGTRRRRSRSSGSVPAATGSATS